MTVPTRNLLVVAGPGRSGTSVTTGLLGRLGYTIPQPEIAANITNPRGFGEPKWAVRLHRQLLAQAKVAHGDARPGAAAATLAVAGAPEVQARVAEWLETQFALSDNVVVKDPRLLWFTDLWSRAAAELGARTVSLTMLRHPVPVTKSNQTHYMELPAPTRVASWVNGALVTERNTRSMVRTSVDYDALLQDWKQVMESALAPVGLPSVSTATPEQVAAGDELVDPSLRRSVSSWEELAIPSYLRDLADRVYEAVCAGAGPGSDDGAVAQTMDALSAEYRELYEHSEAISHATVTQAKRAARARGYREGEKAAKAAAREAKTARARAAAEKAAVAPKQPERSAAVRLLRKLVNRARERATARAR